MAIRHLNAGQVNMLLTVAAESPRDQLMLTLAFQHGLRAREVCSLQLKHFDLTTEHIQITVQRLKGSLKTTQELLPQTAHMVRAYATKHGLQRNDYLFKGNVRTKGTHLGYTTFLAAFKKYCLQASIPIAAIKGPHCLKHSCAMAMIPRGIEYTREHLGHRSLSSTGAYVRVSQQEVNRVAHEVFQNIAAQQDS
jgi:integrase